MCFRHKKSDIKRNRNLTLSNNSTYDKVSDVSIWLGIRSRYSRCWKQQWHRRDTHNHHQSHSYKLGQDSFGSNLHGCCHHRDLYIVRKLLQSEWYHKHQQPTELCLIPRRRTQLQLLFSKWYLQVLNWLCHSFI